MFGDLIIWMKRPGNILRGWEETSRKPAERQNDFKYKVNEDFLYYKQEFTTVRKHMEARHKNK